MALKLKRKINGINWTFKIISSKEMEEISEEKEPCAGLTVSSEKTVYIDNEDVNYLIIAHELYHVYFSNCYLDDTNDITLLDFEEVAAGLFADRGEEMVRKAKKITRDLQKLMEDGE